jgi:hypothetical protein
VKSQQGKAKAKKPRPPPSQSLPLYSPLRRTSSIRILVVQPGAPQDQIVCCLRVVGNIDRRRSAASGTTAYEALSYVWGSQEDRVCIVCNGHAVDVTRNLAHALQRVRRTDEARCIWADAVCIDQGNVTERGHQVRLMGRMYGRAERVLIWAGRDEGHDARSAFALMEKIVYGGADGDSGSQVSLGLSKLGFLAAH